MPETADKQTELTRHFVARHVDEHLTLNPEAVSGCIVCQAFAWGLESSGMQIQTLLAAYRGHDNAVG